MAQKKESQLATLDDQILQLDEVAKKYELAGPDEAPFKRALTLSKSMADLRALLTPEVMAPIYGLMNTTLGFKTDRDPHQKTKNGEYKTPYAMEVVRDVMIEAILRGYRPVGNEINIIAGNFYATKNGLRRRVTNFPGMKEFKDVYGVPRVASTGKGAVVTCTAIWKLNGADDGLSCDIGIKGDDFTGLDAYTGKAERKLLKRVMDRISGFDTPEGDASEVDAPEPKVVEPAKPIFKGKEEPAKEIPVTVEPPKSEPEKSQVRSGNPEAPDPRDEDELPFK